MPSITADGKTQTFSEDKRLVKAIQDLGIEIGHRCGGQARCTTCRVEFVSGEPETMTKAEYAKLTEKGLLGQYRLSCQLTCSNDMNVKVGMTKSSENWPDTGPEVSDDVVPEAVWYPVETLKHSDS